MDNEFEVGLGVNKFELDLKDQVHLKHLKQYELLLNDDQLKKTYSIRIQYVNPDYVK